MTPINVTKMLNSTIFLTLYVDNLDVITGISEIAIALEVDTKPVVLPLPLGNNSDIVVSTSCKTPPAAVNPIIKLQTIQIKLLGNFHKTINVTKDINGYIKIIFKVFKNLIIIKELIKIDKIEPIL